MNKRKVIAAALCLLLAAGSSLGGYAFGQRSGKAQAGEDTSSVRAEDSGVQDTIAVVNLDSGVLENGEQTYYGEQIIEFPDDNFIFTSLEDARAGIENGRYGAYIIIPSDFSESVASLNTVPSAAQIQYAVSDRVSGNEHSEILQQVLYFGEQLNSRMSYMYLCNIMDEFHGAQDEAAMVMRNDAADKEIIDRIQPYDLVGVTEVPELKRQEDTTKTMDVSGYVEENIGLISDIDGEYRSNLANAGMQLDQLKESGNVLVDTLRGVSDHVDEIQLLTAPDGQFLYQTGVNNLRSMLAGYNTAQQAAGVRQNELLDQAEAKRQEFTTSLQQCIDNYNQQLDVWTQETLGRYREAVREQIPQLKLEETEDPGQYRLTCGEISGRGEPPSVIIRMEQEVSPEGAENREYLDRIIGLILTAEVEAPGEEGSGGEEENPGGEGEPPGGEEKPPGSEEEPPEGEEGRPGGEEEPPGGDGGNSGEETDVPGEGDDPGEKPEPVYVPATVQEALQQCDEDETIAEFLAEHDYLDTAAFLQAYLEGNVNVETQTFRLTVTGDIDGLEQYLMDSIYVVDTTGYQPPHFTGQWTDRTGQRIAFRDMMTDIGILHERIRAEMNAEEEIAIQSVEELVLGECIGPLADRTEDVKHLFTDRHAEELAAIAQYRDSMNQYRPKQDASVMNEKAGQMRANAVEMQQEIWQSNESYMDYADRVYDTAEQNIMTLQEHIQEAKEASQQAVAEGLAEAKDTKQETSSENQSAMADFAAKLPYTRIGSMESTQAYEFIASPVQLLPVSDYQRLKDEVDYTAAGNREAGVQTNVKHTGKTAEIICYAVLGILMAGAAVRVIWYRRKRGQEQPAG